MDFRDLLEPRFAGERRTLGRSEFERDQDRLLFSSAFRRLNDKTQVFPVPESYFVHNRMTHSLETSAVGRSLGNIVGERVLAGHGDWGEPESRLLGDLVRAACLAHDIGNPPFGHSGEDAISAFFLRNPELLAGLDEAEAEEFRRFEGNAQGLRVIASISPDLRLTTNTIATFTKYPREGLVRDWIDPEFEKRKDQRKYGAFASETGLLREALEGFGCRPLAGSSLAFARFPFAYLVEAADDICYLVIDLEDAVRLRIVRLPEVEGALEALIGANPEGGALESRRPGADDNERMAYLRARAINSLVFQCAETFGARVGEIDRGEYGGSLIGEIPSGGLLDEIRSLSSRRIYRDRPVLEIEAAGFEVIRGLLELLCEAALSEKSGPGPARARLRMILDIMPAVASQEGESPYRRLRRIVDYVAGMTDSYALGLYKKLKGFELPHMY